MLAQAGAPLCSKVSSNGEEVSPPSLLALDEDINFVEAVFLLGEVVCIML